VDRRQHYEFPASRKGLVYKEPSIVYLHLICRVLGGVDLYVSLLLLQSAELILAIVDSKQEALSALLPTLLRIGLLTDLIEGEVTAITGGTSTCGSEFSPLPPFF
jgi:hypothetical protein